MIGVIVIGTDQLSVNWVQIPDNALRVSISPFLIWVEKYCTLSLAKTVSDYIYIPTHTHIHIYSKTGIHKHTHTHLTSLPLSLSLSIYIYIYIYIYILKFRYVHYRSRSLRKILRWSKSITMMKINLIFIRVINDQIDEYTAPANVLTIIFKRH